MGLASGRELHIDQNLTDIAINYRPQGMIADTIAPVIIVDKETNVYPVFNQGEALQIPDTRRSRGARAKRITRSVSSGNYSAKNYALAYDLPIEDRGNMDAAYAFQLDLSATFMLTDYLMLDWDKRVLQMVGSASNCSTGFVPSSSWAAAGANAGDPVVGLWQAQEQIQSQTGYKPNSILWGWRSWNFARRNYQFRNFVNGVNNGRGAITRQQAQDALELDRFNVSGAFYNSANEAQAAVLANTFPADAVLLYYAPLGPSREVPSFMYSFRWSNPTLPTPFAVERHPYESKEKIDSIEAGYYQDEKITSPALGALILGVGSAQSNGIGT